MTPMAQMITRFHVALLLSVLAAGCQGMPTFESIRYGYDPARVEHATEPPARNQSTDVAGAWTRSDDQASAPVLYGRDGSPVTPGTPGTVVRTTNPINEGVDAGGEAGGSRSLMLDKYIEATEARQQLQEANEGLSAALEMAEARSRELEEQLLALQSAYDELSAAKKESDAGAIDLAARLATAQIARLEAERALLEATIEWRRISAANNAPLNGGEEGP